MDKYDIIRDLLDAAPNDGSQDDIVADMLDDLIAEPEPTEAPAATACREHVWDAHPYDNRCHRCGITHAAWYSALTKR